MTIDYKALAERIESLIDRLLDSEEHAVEAAIPPIAEEVAEAMSPLISLLREPTEAQIEAAARRMSGTYTKN